MFTSNQQIVVDSRQGNTYGPKDMEVGVVGMDYKKKGKIMQTNTHKTKCTSRNMTRPQVPC
jgi:hypothetical protein